MNDIILYFAHKFFGDWERIYDALEKQEDIDFDEIDRIKEEYKDMYITVLDKEYPRELRQIERPPFVIFYKGNLDLLKRKAFWYFGTYFEDLFEKEALKHKKDFKQQNFSMVLGYTNDFERLFINSIKPEESIIVRDSGINSGINMTKIEEAMFLKNNLIISEYPDKVIPSLHTWETSNRIKSGISLGLFLINSSKEKMTFKIIADTIDENRNIFCYNKNIDTKSHNMILIEKGAYSIKEIEELNNG